MGKFAIGQVVSITFPFSDLTSQKQRPVLVVAHAEFDNLILCQITSKAYSSSRSIAVARSDFSDGGLPINSYLRPDKLFTADPSIIRNTYGAISGPKLQEALAAIRDLFTS